MAPGWYGCGVMRGATFRVPHWRRPETRGVTARLCHHGLRLFLTVPAIDHFPAVPCAETAGSPTSALDLRMADRRLRPPKRRGNR